MVVRPAMIRGLKMVVALTKSWETELEVVELKMSRFSLEVARIEEIRNEYIRGTA